MEMHHWLDGRRSDGLAVVASLDCWIVLPKDERPVIDRCPFCRAPLESRIAAQVVADMAYPLPD